MTRAYSDDLRGRVIAAVSNGMSARAAAARFGIGVSTAIVWARRYRESGERSARQQGKRPGSKLDAHEAFILTLIDETPDITLVEIGERLKVEHGVSACAATLHGFLAKRGMTFKKRRRTRANRVGRT